MKFDAEKIRKLSEKLREFTSCLESDEKVLLSAMLLYGDLAKEQRHAAKITDATGNAVDRFDIKKAFEEALVVGTGSTLVRSPPEATQRPVTIDFPPVTGEVSLGPLTVGTTIDPDPVTIPFPDL